jgi:hypothetical protein
MSDYTLRALQHASEALTDTFMDRNKEKVASAAWGALLGGLAGAASEVHKLRKLRMLTPNARTAVYKASDDAVKKQVRDSSYILSPAEKSAKREAEILHGADKNSKSKIPAPSLGTPGKDLSAAGRAGESLAMKAARLKKNNPYAAAGMGNIARGALEGAITGGVAGKGLSAYKQYQKRQAMKTLGKNIALPAAAGIGAGALLSRKN